MKLNDKIYEYRKIKRWSQEELAEKLEVSRQTVSKWEVGKAIPELDKLIKLSEVFGITVDELVKEEIEIMRLMGVSNWYIRIPLIMQGSLYGFVGALLALIPVDIVQSMLNNIHTFFLVPKPMFAGNIVIVSMIILGIAFGASGSFLSIKKHLQV